MSYRALKRQFGLDDDYLEDLKAEIIDAKQLALDEEGKVLVWTGKDSPGSSVQRLESKPILYTPRHLAERILAEQGAMDTPKSSGRRGISNHSSGSARCRKAKSHVTLPP